MAAPLAMEMASSRTASSFHAFSSRPQLLSALGRRNTLSFVRASSQPVPPPKENGGEKTSEKTIIPEAANVNSVSASTPLKAPAPAPAAKPKPKKVSTNPMDILAFSGPGPETINGRLAMLGFAAALGVEAVTGNPLAAQVGAGSSGAEWFVLAALVISGASLVPMFKGVTRESRAGAVMSAQAETWNGRAAMLGLVALAVTEYIKQGPLI